MNRLLLHNVYLECVELHIKHLAEIHDERLVNHLPQVSTEDLDVADLESRDFSVHEDSCEIQLNLETNVDVCSVDGRRPPERKATVRNLIQTRALRVR